MAVNLSPLGGVAAQFFNNDGVPLSGGLIYTYLAGTNTPATTYTTGAGNIAHSNPIVLDAAGRVPTGEIWLSDGISYKFVIKDSSANLIGTYDNLVGINSNFVNYTASQEIQTATAGQTVFTLTSMVYQPGTNSLSVFVDGVNQYGPGAQYAFVETDSTTVTFASGLHVGASVKFTTSQINSSAATNANQVSYEPPFNGAVPTNVELKLAQFVTLEDFGAVGDGVANDTQALIDACAFIESSTDVNVLYVTKIYSIDWLTIPNNYIEFTRDDVTICGGGTLLARPAAYSAGVANGAFKFYTAFYFTGNRGTVKDITFDGNNEFSQYASSPSLPNYWFNAVYFQGLVGNRTIGGRVINCRYINGGGWPFRGQYHNYGLIQGCYVEHSQGCGFDAGSLCVVANNVSYNAHDAHFATWNSIGGVISGNTCDTNDNGSGIDVSGSADATVIGNTIRNNANRGIWVVQDPNTATPCRNVTIVGNALTVNNTYVPISERGDIQVGPTDVTTDSRPPGTVDCRGLTISGNTIFSNAGANAITLGKYAFYTNITGNSFIDDGSSSANRSVVIWYSQNTIIRNNYDLIAIRRGAAGQPKILGSGPIWFDDANTSLDTSVAPTALSAVQTNFVVQTNRQSNPGNTYQIVKNYGFSEYGAEFVAVNGSKNVVEINFTSGGFEVAAIEVIATVGGDRGAVSGRVVYQGSASTTPTQIVAATTVFTGGAAAPTLAYTAATGKVTISVSTNDALSASLWMRVSGTAGTVPNITSLV
jgi:hypothetical protein